jgi:PatG Domain
VPPSTGYMQGSSIHGTLGSLGLDIASCGRVVCSIRNQPVKTPTATWLIFIYNASAPDHMEEKSINTDSDQKNMPEKPISSITPSQTEATMKSCGCGGMTDATNTPPISYIYALGRIQPRFPRPAIEKEFFQVIGRAETAGLTDREALQSVLSQRQNRYLVRQMCWVLTIEGVETYIVIPRDPADFDLLVEALRPSPRATDIDVIVGTRGPLASPELCNGLLVPIVMFDQIYSFG